MELRAQTQNLLVIVRHGNDPKELHELNDGELAELAQFLANELQQVSNFMAWRGGDPTDEELCEMAKQYEPEIECIEYAPKFGFY